jgi:Uma2 family endonuclease
MAIIVLWFSLGDEYQQTQFRLGDWVISPTFPQLRLRLDDLLPKTYATIFCL